MKENTLKAYTNGIRLLSATKLWPMRLDKITRSAVLEVTFPHGAYNANRGLSTLRHLLSYAEELGILRSAPRIDKHEEEGRERVLTPEEEAVILKCAPPVLRDKLIVMRLCGMRPDEVSRIQWDDIRGIDNVVFVQRGKTAKARRYVELKQEMRDAFARSKSRNQKRKLADSPYVFATNRNPKGYICNINKTWARTIERVDAYLATQGKPPIAKKWLVPYAMRHTYATEYLRDGGSVYMLMRLMGHTRIETTMRYVHIVEAGGTPVMTGDRKLKIVRSA